MYRVGGGNWQVNMLTRWCVAKASRPELNRLMHDAGQRKFDVILCWKLDRFGRSLLHCKSALQELQAHGVRFIATSQNIDTDESNPAARFLLHILMAAAEFERELIRERSMAGVKGGMTGNHRGGGKGDH
jgi:DNA invertase Pin-like site-specific DNA recombinase